MKFPTYEQQLKELGQVQIVKRLSLKRIFKVAYEVMRYRQASHGYENRDIDIMMSPAMHQKFNETIVRYLKLRGVVLVSEKLSKRKTIFDFDVTTLQTPFLMSLQISSHDRSYGFGNSLYMVDMSDVYPDELHNATVIMTPKNHFLFKGVKQITV